MIVLDQNNAPTVDAWFPYGRFAWNHEYRRKPPILGEAQLRGEEWPLYAVVFFFKGGFERLDAVHSALEEKLAKSANRFW